MRGKASALLAAVVLLGACGGSDTKSGGDASPTSAGGTGTTAAGGATTAAASSSAGKKTVSYVMWDSNQLPAYQACAAAFEKANPSIQIDVKQLGWDDYWSGLTNGFVAGNAPDVFTDHLAKYPEFAETGQILPLNDFIARDKVDTSAYFPGLVDLWKRPNGDQFGLPKDWDTIGFTFNTKMLADAGIDPASLASLTWNPKDGGTFEKTIAKLSVDKNGKRGDEAGFDPNNVKTYGFGIPGTGGAYGQTEWSFFTASNGWNFMNQPFWGTKYNYDDPKFVETIAWLQGLTKKGYMTPFTVFSATSHMDLFKAGTSAVTSLGSWEIGDAVKAEFKVGFFPTPVGPTGKRASMFNGLSDSIYAKTKVKEEAWQWVKFLATSDCQNLVGDTGVVFPALKSGVDKAVAKRKADGVDVAAFTTHVDNKTTFTFPISDHASDIGAIMTPAMEEIFSKGADPAKVLADANAKVNKLFG